MTIRMNAAVKIANCISTITCVSVTIDRCNNFKLPSPQGENPASEAYWVPRGRQNVIKKQFSCQVFFFDAVTEDFIYNSESRSHHME